MNDAAITAKLGVDTAGFRTGLAQAGREADNFSRGVMGGNERMLESHRRVENTIKRFTRNLIEGGGAADILANGLEGVTRAFRIGLGSAVAVGLGADLISAAAKAHEGWKKVNEELQKARENLSKPGATSQEEAEKRKQLDAAVKAKKDVGIVSTFVGTLVETALATDRSRFAWLKRTAPTQDPDLFRAEHGQPAVNPANNLGAAGGSPRDQFEKYKYFILGQRGDNSDSQPFGDMAAPWADPEAKLMSMRRENDKVLKETTEALQDAKQPGYLKQARGTLDQFHSKINDAYQPFFDERGAIHIGGDAIAEPLRRALAAALADVAEKVGTARKERLRTSLGDLAANGDTWRGLDGSEHGVGAKAREALREEQMAHAEVLKGHMDEAQKHQNRADQIKNQLDPLKDSEKDLKGEFQGALDSSKVLQEIKEKLNYKSVN